VKESLRFSGCPSLTAEEVVVKLLYGRCAGLDIHKKSVSACIRISRGASTEIVTGVFGTFTRDLESLRDWLQKNQVQQVAMESTGVYWVPVWNVLERCDAFTLTLVNPQHVHALPGCKTDRRDAKRISELLQYGLLRASFIPPRPVRELRDLTRRRTHLQSDRNRVLNRINRLLETANLKIGSVVSDIAGKTGTLILDRITRGRSNPEELVELAQGSLKNKKAELAESLNGFYSEHLRWLLREAVEDLRHLDHKLLQVDQRIGEQVKPHVELIRRLCTIPGVEFTTATTILAEIGLDMSRFPDPGHLASWAGLCPGNNESGGKRLSGRTRRGDRYLRRILVQSAWSVIHKKDCFLTAVFHRVAARRGMKKAAMAVAHRMLIIAWHIIRDGGIYQEAGGSYFDRLHPDRSARRLMRRLQQIGFDVTLTGTPPKPASSKPERNRPQPTQPTVPLKPPAADPKICRKCARWGIPCIHLRNRRALAAISPPIASST
jgi:transposase